MKRAWWLALFLLANHALTSQVIHFSSTGNTANQTGGAVVELSDDNTVSRISVGGQQTHFVGFGREVSVGNTTLILGSSTPSLHLPTDLADTQRLVYAEGALLHMAGARKSADTFFGVSGQSSVAAINQNAQGKAMLISSAAMTTGKVLWQGLMVRGQQRSVLVSSGFAISRSTMLALTAGMCAGKPVSRIFFSHAAPTWSVEANDTSGHLSLQPEQAMEQTQLESIGLNASATKHFGNWLTVGGSRREYDTSTAGISAMASRSSLLEGGAAAHFGSFQAAARLLASRSGTAHDRGRAWIAGWAHNHASAQAMIMQRTDTLGVHTTTLQMDTTHQLHRHVQGSAGMLLANGTPSADAGVTFAGNWGSLSVNHTQTYVPFGTSTGFHRVLTLAVHLNVHNADVGVARVSGTGLESTWQGSLNGYEEMSGSGAQTSALSHTIRRYRLEGIVLAEGRPVAGAAVAVGPELVYTDSDGHWMARFSRTSPVRVQVQPEEFLSEDTYCTANPAATATPAETVTPITAVVTHCVLPVAPHGPAKQLETSSSSRHRRPIMLLVRELVTKVVKVWR